MCPPLWKQVEFNGHTYCEQRTVPLPLPIPFWGMTGKMPPADAWAEYQERHEIFAMEPMTFFVMCGCAMWALSKL